MNPASILKTAFVGGLLAAGEPAHAQQAAASKRRTDEVRSDPPAAGGMRDDESKPLLDRVFDHFGIGEQVIVQQQKSRHGLELHLPDGSTRTYIIGAAPQPRCRMDDAFRFGDPLFVHVVCADGEKYPGALFESEGDSMVVPDYLEGARCESPAVDTRACADAVRFHQADHDYIVAERYETMRATQTCQVQVNSAAQAVRQAVGAGLGPLAVLSSVALPVAAVLAMNGEERRP